MGPGTARDPAAESARRAYKYKAFVSYSHQSDQSFAPVLQRVLERLAKPWHRRRAIQLFRDQTDLAVSPGLWPRIAGALDDSEHLLLLGSPAAAQSPWVAKEIEHWRSNHDIGNLVVALTEGEIVWEERRSDFDWTRTTAIPRSLAGVFASEPLWADFREARTAQKDATAFREPAVRLAAGLRGMSPRDLDGEDLQQHRRTIRIAGIAIAALLALTIISAIATVQALRQRGLAISRELSALSAARLGTDPDLSVLLALRAGEVATTPQAERALRAALPVSHARHTFRNTSFYLNSVSFRGDGKRLLTSNGWSLLGHCMDCTARTWSTETGQVLATFSGHGSPVRGSSFSQDGGLVLTQAGEPVARVWNAESGKLVAELDHHAPIGAAAFSPDGKSVVTAGENGIARIWSLGGGTPIELKHQDALNDARFSPDGQSVLTAAGRWRVSDSLAGGLFAEDRSTRFLVSVWNAGTGRERFRLPVFAAPVSMARFSADGRSIVTASGDRAAVWDAGDGRRIAELRGHTGGIAAVAFSGDGRWIATASSDTTARVWNARTGELRAELRGHQLALHLVAINRDGSFVVTAGGDPYAVVWDVATGRPLGQLRGHDQAITDLALSADDRMIATTSNDGRVRVWRIPPGGAANVLGPAGAVDKVALSFDGERILVESDRLVTVWARRTGAKLASLGPAPTFSHPSWSADGRRVIVPGQREGAVVFDAASGVRLKELSGDFRLTALSPDGKRMAAYEQRAKAIVIRETAGDGVVARVPIEISLDERGLEYSADGRRLLLLQFAVGGGQLRDAGTGALMAKFTGKKMRFSPSGRHVLEVDGEGSVPRVYDCENGKEVAVLGSSRSLVDAAFVPGDEQVITVESFGMVEVWDVRQQRLASKFQITVPLLGSVAISPDGRFLAMSGQHNVEVWSLQTHQRLADLSGHTEDTKGVAFAPGSLGLVSGAGDGTLRVYPAEAFLPFDEVVARARATVSRALTEWEIRDPNP